MAMEPDRYVKVPLLDMNGKPVPQQTWKAET